MVEVGQDLVHFFLLVILHALSKLVHHINFVLGLLAQHQRQQRSFLAFEVLGVFFPLFVDGYNFALVDEVSKYFD